MENQYQNLLYLEARDPQKLKDMLNNISVPSQIVQGSWTRHNLMHGVWVMLDRPLKSVKKRDLKQIERTEKTKTEKLIKEL